MPNREGPGRQRSTEEPARPEGAPSRSPRQGRSGYGVESLRPHLHDQLALKDLLRPSMTLPGPRRKPEPREEG